MRCGGGAVSRHVTVRIISPEMETEGGGGDCDLACGSGHAYAWTDGADAGNLGLRELPNTKQGSVVTSHRHHVRFWIHFGSI
jgi:hypothetical protein